MRIQTNRYEGEQHNIPPHLPRASHHVLLPKKHPSITRAKHKPKLVGGLKKDGVASSASSGRKDDMSYVLWMGWGCLGSVGRHNCGVSQEKSGEKEREGKEMVAGGKKDARSSNQNEPPFRARDGFIVCSGISDGRMSRPARLGT
jgi:hypothetical protein